MAIESLEPQVPSITQLEAAFDREIITDTWAAAETAYALAVRSQDIGAEHTRTWVERLLDILADFPTSSLEQTATQRVSVGGVMLPDFLHDDLVKSRFSDLLRAC